MDFFQAKILNFHPVYHVIILLHVMEVSSLAWEILLTLSLYAYFPYFALIFYFLYFQLLMKNFT